MKILVINAGSSSIKYQLIDMDDESVIAKGQAERIGIEEFCARSDCIPWEALVSITKRVPRVYRGLRIQ